MKLTPATTKKDGMIRPSRSLFAKKLGFTDDKYKSSSYLWKIGEYIYISYIEVHKKRQGHFTQLLKNICNQGYGVKVPVPLPEMEEILKKKGFIETIEWNDKSSENIDVWLLEGGI